MCKDGCYAKKAMKASMGEKTPVPLLEIKEGKLEMHLKWFDTPEEAQAALEEAMKNLEKVKGQIMNEEKVPAWGWPTPQKLAEEICSVQPVYVGSSDAKCCGEAPKDVVQEPVGIGCDVGQKLPGYKFVPKKDISTYELAQLFNAWWGEYVITQRTYDSLDYNCQRHFKAE